MQGEPPVKQRRLEGTVGLQVAERSLVVVVDLVVVGLLLASFLGSSWRWGQG
jgi:hypothetical protein